MHTGLGVEEESLFGPSVSIPVTHTDTSGWPWESINDFTATMGRSVMDLRYGLGFVQKRASSQSRITVLT